MSRVPKTQVILGGCQPLENKLHLWAWWLISVFHPDDIMYFGMSTFCPMRRFSIPRFGPWNWNQCKAFACFFATYTLEWASNSTYQHTNSWNSYELWHLIFPTYPKIELTQPNSSSTKRTKTTKHHHSLIFIQLQKDNPVIHSTLPNFLPQLFSSFPRFVSHHQWSPVLTRGLAFNPVPKATKGAKLLTKAEAEVAHGTVERWSPGGGGFGGGWQVVYLHPGKMNGWNIICVEVWFRSFQIIFLSFHGWWL